MSCEHGTPPMHLRALRQPKQPRFCAMHRVQAAPRCTVRTQHSPRQHADLQPSTGFQHPGFAPSIPTSPVRPAPCTQHQPTHKARDQHPPIFERYPLAFVDTYASAPRYFPKPSTLAPSSPPTRPVTTTATFQSPAVPATYWQLLAPRRPRTKLATVIQRYATILHQK